jgi:hypothetical protein
LLDVLNTNGRGTTGLFFIFHFFILFFFLVGKIDKNKTVVIDSSSVVDRLNIPSEIAVWQKKRKKSSNNSVC